MVEKQHPPNTASTQTVFDAPQDILMNAPIGIFTSTPQGTFLSVNPALARMYGYDCPQDLIDSVSDTATQVYVDPADRETFVRLLEQHGEVVDHQCRIKRKDGTIIWVSRNVRVIKDQDGIVVAFQGFTSDITDQKLADSALRERIKELNCLYSISKLIEQEDNPDNILQSVVHLLLNGWQHDEVACARIIFEGRHYQTTNFRETEWRQSVNIQVHGQPAGMIDLCYLEERPTLNEGPFLNEERNLINAIAERLGKVIGRKRTEEHLQQVLDATNDGIWDYDLATGKFACSERFAQMLGYKSDEIQDFGCFCEDNIHPEDAVIFRKAFDDYVHGRNPIYALEFRLKTKTSGYKWIYTRGRALRRDDAGRAMRVVGAHTDITERKRAEEALRKSEERFSLAMEAAKDGLWDWDVRTNNVYYSPGYAGMLGYETTEVPGHLKSWIDLLHPEDKEKAIKASKDCIENRVESFAVEFRMQAKNGDWKWILGRGRAVSRDTSGKARRIIGTHTDITERKQTEEKIRTINEQLQQVNAEKDKLFSIIAHDLRSPIAGLMTSTDLIANQLDIFPEKDLRFLAMELHKNAKNSFELLEDLLQWARMNQGGISYAPTYRSLEDMVNMGLPMAQDLAKSKEILLRMDIFPDLTVRVDQPMIKTVIRNILFNAIKFTPRGGEIVISAHREGQNVTMAIQDNGIGMNEQVLSSIFTLVKDKCQLGTEGEKGTGLGLVLCKQFIEQHGGVIWVESVPGKGTTVFFTLPLAEAP